MNCDLFGNPTGGATQQLDCLPSGRGMAGALAHLKERWTRAEQEVARHARYPLTGDRRRDNAALRRMQQLDQERAQAKADYLRARDFASSKSAAEVAAEARAVRL
jgi:ribosomal protein L15